MAEPTPLTAHQIRAHALGIVVTEPPPSAAQLAKWRDQDFRLQATLFRAQLKHLREDLQRAEAERDFARRDCNSYLDKLETSDRRNVRLAWVCSLTWAGVIFVALWWWFRR